MFKDTIRTLHDTGLQISVHCGGDAAVDLTLDAYEAALNANPRSDHRHRIEPAVISTKDATKRIKDLGVVIQSNPTPPSSVCQGIIMNRSSLRNKWIV